MGGSRFDKLFKASTPIEFVNTIRDVATYKGASGSTFYNCEYDGLKYIVKMTPLSKQAPELYNTDVSGLMNVVETEIEVLKLFRRKFIKTGKTPCIIEAVYALIRDVPQKITEKERGQRDMDPEVVEKYNEVIDSFIFHTENDLMEPRIAFIVLEKCDCTIAQFFNTSTVFPFERKIRTSLIFYILHCLYIVTKKYPGFKHYDLHGSNILLRVDPNFSKHIDKEMPYCTLWGPNQKPFNVPYFGFYPKIIDFSFSVVPSKNIVSVASLDKYLRALRKSGDFTFFVTNIATLDPFYEAFVERIKTTELADVFEDPLFDEYKVKPDVKFRGTKIREYNI